MACRTLLYPRIAILRVAPGSRKQPCPVQPTRVSRLPSLTRLPVPRDPQPSDGRAFAPEEHRAGDAAPARPVRERDCAAGAATRNALPGKPGPRVSRAGELPSSSTDCFWHGHPDFFTPGKSGAYWDAKIERTKERDRRRERRRCPR